MHWLPIALVSMFSFFLVIFQFKSNTSLLSEGRMYAA